MSGNDMLCPHCGEHHHTAEHDDCRRPLTDVQKIGLADAILAATRGWSQEEREALILEIARGNT